jgi:hypothetical protein
LKILQININGIQNKIYELNQLVQEHDIDIILIQETKLKSNNKTPYIPNFSYIRKDRIDNNGGGLLIYIKSNIIFTEIKIPDTVNQHNTEIQLVKLHFNKDKFLHIANLYIHPRDAQHPHNSTIDSDIKKCVEFVTKHKNAMLTGDINAHSTLWFSKNTDKRGELITNLLSDSDQVILNLNCSTRQPSTASQQPTSPDITTIASNLSHYATWEILHALSSDHLPIKITLNTKTNFKMIQNRNMYTNYKKANWEQYQKEIEELIPNDTTITDVHLANSLLTNIILKSDKHHIPKGKM